MDRYDTFIEKITAVDRFNHGALNLANEDVTLTGVFNGFLRYLLDEWVVGPPVPPDAAEDMAKRIVRRMSFGLRAPNDRQRLIDFVASDDADTLPLLAVRWLMRNAEITVVMPYLGVEWREFAKHYQHVIAALDPALFNWRDDK